MIKIELNKNEYNYLSQAPFVPTNFRTTLCSAQIQKETYSLKISEEQADVIRDLCGERLQRVGFDEKYQPTREGKILEALVDKFFVK